MTENGSDQELEDVTQSIIYLPYRELQNSENIDDSLLPDSLVKERDFPTGKIKRLQAYQQAWDKLLSRIKAIIRDIYNPVVEAVVIEIDQSYANVVPGLPFPEIPVVCITEPSSSSAFLNDVTHRLEATDRLGRKLSHPSSLIIDMYPTNYPNIATAMKNIVTGFIEKEGILNNVKRKPSTSLANYDIRLLGTWYAAVTEVAGPGLKLVIIIHNFEQCDPFVMEDVFHICSLHILSVPIVFVLMLSSPTSPSYIHIAYPRRTLSLLRISNFVIPSSGKTLEHVLLKTFFDTEFEPDIMIGPGTIEYLKDYFARYNSSIDTIVTVLQLTYLKHFTNDPICALALSTPTEEALAQPSSLPFNNYMSVRLSEHTFRSPNQPPSKNNQSISKMVDIIDATRSDFYNRASRIRIGFNIMKVVNNHIEKQGLKGLAWESDQHHGVLCQAMINVLNGRYDKDLNYLGNIIRNLDTTMLHILLEEIRIYINKIPSHLHSNEEDARNKIDTFRNMPSGDSQFVDEVSLWFTEYLGTLLHSLEDALLWDVWYTGQSPFPSEILNPSIRASLISGLLSPHDFSETNDTSISLPELPDTSILFNRYLDSGKMINLYDWFESFQSVLEVQRQALVPPATPRKAKMSKKSNEAKQSEERWRIEVQARFIRAVQELDYLGLLKHTGRKPEHVLRTVMEVQE